MQQGRTSVRQMQTSSFLPADDVLTIFPLSTLFVWNTNDQAPIIHFVFVEFGIFHTMFLKIRTIGHGQNLILRKRKPP